MRGLIRRAAVAAIAYLGLLLFAADDLGSVPVLGPVPGGRLPVQRPARHRRRTAHGAGLWLGPDRPGQEGAEMINARQA